MLKYQSVNQEQLKRAIENIPIPLDDISMSSLSNASYMSGTTS